MRRFVPALVVLCCTFGSALASAGAAELDRSHAVRGESPRPPRALRINEIDYDQPGFDTGEFIEIVNTGERRLRLRGTAVVLVNGTTSGEYRRVALSGRLGPRRAVVVATSSVQVASGARSIPLPLARDNVQNGAPDAVALIHDGRDVLLDALSYEGAIGAATIEGMPGTWNLVEGDPVTESDTNDGTVSLCRMPHGRDSGEDDTDWRACTPTPGATNTLG